MKHGLLIFSAIILLSFYSQAQNFSICEEKALFSPITNHKI